MVLSGAGSFPRHGAFHRHPTAVRADYARFLWCVAFDAALEWAFDVAFDRA